MALIYHLGKIFTGSLFWAWSNDESELFNVEICGDLIGNFYQKFEKSENSK